MRTVQRTKEQAVGIWCNVLGYPDIHFEKVSKSTKIPPPVLKVGPHT
jgi:hypothetical protein